MGEQGSHPSGYGMQGSIGASNRRAGFDSCRVWSAGFYKRREWMSRVHTLQGTGCRGRLVQGLDAQGSLMQGLNVAGFRRRRDWMSRVQALQGTAYRVPHAQGLKTTIKGPNYARNNAESCLNLFRIALSITPKPCAQYRQVSPITCIPPLKVRRIKRCVRHVVRHHQSWKDTQQPNTPFPCSYGLYSAQNGFLPHQIWA